MREERGPEGNQGGEPEGKLTKLPDLVSDTDFIAACKR